MHHINYNRGGKSGGKIQLEVDMNFTDLSDRELMVMKCLWESDSPMTVGELIISIEEAYNIVYKETTVYTFLKRLKDKKYVTSYKKGTSRFSPCVGETEFLEDYAARMADFWSEDASKTFLAAYGRFMGQSERD